ncbi:hypothetical protein V2G26_014136 [Clonostachys chloroleuca]
MLDGGEGRMWAGSGDGWGAPAYLRRRYWAGADVLKDIYNSQPCLLQPRLLPAGYHLIWMAPREACAGFDNLSVLTQNKRPIMQPPPRWTGTYLGVHGAPALYRHGDCDITRYLYPRYQI